MFLRPAACLFLGLVVATIAMQAQTSAPGDLETLLADARRARLAGDRSGALAVLDTVLARAQAERLPLIEAQARRQLSTAYVYTEEWPRAIEQLQKARALFAAAGDRGLETRCLLDEAVVRRSEGKAAEASAMGRQAAATFRELHDRQGLADALELVLYLMPDAEDHGPLRAEALTLVDDSGKTIACGALHEWADDLFGRGRGGDAFIRINEARECFHRTGQRDREARSLVSLGRVYRLHGRLDEALANYHRALDLHEWPGSPDRAGAVQAMNAIAVTLSMLGRYDEAGAQYEATLARARRTAPSVVPTYVGNLGGFRLAQGNYAEALTLLDEAIATAPNGSAIALRHAQRGSALAGLGRTDEARASFDRAVELAATRGRDDRMAVRRNRARFLFTSGRFADAEADLRVLTDIIEEGRAHTIPSDVMRRGFIEAQQDVFGAYIDLLGLQGKAAEALAVAERARARAFLDLRADRAGDARLATPASVEDAGRAAAHHRSTILAYWVGPSAVSIWVVRPDREPALVRVPVLPSRLTSLVQATAGLEPAGAARGLLMTDRAQRAPWRELERLLIAPVRSLLPRAPGSRLTIVPHGPLFALSFAALRQADGTTLLEAHDLHYVPAIGALTPASTAAPPVNGGALVVGDPGSLPTEPGMEPLPALPWARREVAAVRTALGPGTTQLTAGDANESAVRAALTGRRVLHFATHGIVSNATTSPSFLALHPSSDGADGRLLADEIYDLRLDADLVVLSACRTALGPVEGDGVIGFARAFLSAGAHSVIATQWDVSDRVSYDVMRRFYARRAQGASKSRALRDAQLAVLRALRAGTIRVDGVTLPETPRLWAGFVLTGEP